MDADSVIIEYLRQKLQGARKGRAAKALQPPVSIEVETEGGEMSPDDEGELMGALGASEDGKCAECGQMMGECSC